MPHSRSTAPPSSSGRARSSSGTEAGLQHATHIYEGEGKVLGVRLAEILDEASRRAVAPVAAPVVGDFLTISRSVHDAYANRIVGF